MKYVDNKLSFWVNNELKIRGWSQRELARRSGVSSTSVSEVTSGTRVPTFDFCAAIAKPLEKDPVEVFRLAGLLPKHNQKNMPDGLTIDEAELLSLYRQIPSSDLRDYIRAFIATWLEKGNILDEARNQS